MPCLLLSPMEKPLSMSNLPVFRLENSSFRSFLWIIARKADADGLPVLRPAPVPLHVRVAAGGDPVLLHLGDQLLDVLGEDGAVDPHADVQEGVGVTLLTVVHRAVVVPGEFLDQLIGPGLEGGQAVDSGLERTLQAP